jgi:hypothetical protein
VGLNTQYQIYRNFVTRFIEPVGMMCSISNHATTKSCLNHPVNQFVRTVRKHIVPVRLLTVAKFIQMDTINIQMKLKHTDPIRHLP